MANHVDAHRIVIATKTKADAEAGSGSARVTVYSAANVALARQNVTLSALGAGSLEDYEFEATNLPQVPNALAPGDISYQQLEDSDGTAVVRKTATGATVEGQPFAFASYKYTAG